MKIATVQVAQSFRKRRLRVLLLALEESLYEAHLPLSSCDRRSAALSTNHEAKLLAEQRVIVVGATHHQSSGTRAQFTYTARLSTEVLSFDVHAHTTRFHILRQFIRNIVAQAFLASEPLRVDSGNPCEFGDSNQVLGGQIPTHTLPRIGKIWCSHNPVNRIGPSTMCVFSSSGQTGHSTGNSVLIFGSPSYPSVMSHNAPTHRRGVSRPPGELRSNPMRENISPAYRSNFARSSSVRGSRIFWAFMIFLQPDN